MAYTPCLRTDDDDDDEELDQFINTEQTTSVGAGAEAPTPTEHVGEQHTRPDTDDDDHTTRQQQQHVYCNTHTAIPRPASGSTINPSVPMEPSSTQPNIRIHNPDLLIHNIWTTWTFNR